MSPPDHKRCLGCGYILDGLPEPRCPECGREFDPDDACTYQKHLTSGWKYFFATLVGLIGVVGLPVVGGLALAYLTPGPDWLFWVVGFPVVVLWSVSLVLMGFACFRAIRALWMPTNPVTHRGALVGACALVLLLVSTLLAVAFAAFRRV